MPLFGEHVAGFGDVVFFLIENSWMISVGDVNLESMKVRCNLELRSRTISLNPILIHINLP